MKIGACMIKIVIISLCFFAGIVLSTGKTVYSYGYKREEDPLITTFKAIIFHGKQDNWLMVQNEIENITDRINDINTLFNIDFKPLFTVTVREQDFRNLCNQMATLVFFAIKEKFYYNKKEQLKIFVRAKVRLRLAEEYYTALLAGNVLAYDERHATSLHKEIMERFSGLRDTIGSAGFLGAGAKEPNLYEFNTMAEEIESLLLTAFPYFDTNRE
ncbi:MAG: hypothetical protein A2W17_10575 [Planctomycetes bacterium RBG_16_41_13]|nr:MAG: hypothetical protein A2W17_10575 [Planctomycetes bacterium RBG_16_41_13]